MEELSAVQIGTLIKYYRKNSGLTQFELAEMVGIDDKQIGKIERGVHYPSVPTFLKLIKILQISIDKFYTTDNTQILASENRLSRLIRKLSPEQANKAYKIIKVILSD